MPDTTPIDALGHLCVAITSGSRVWTMSKRNRSLLTRHTHQDRQRRDKRSNRTAVIACRCPIQLSDRLSGERQILVTLQSRLQVPSTQWFADLQGCHAVCSLPPTWFNSCDTPSTGSAAVMQTA